MSSIFDYYLEKEEEKKRGKKSLNDVLYEKERKRMVKERLKKDLEDRREKARFKAQSDLDNDWRKEPERETGFQTTTRYAKKSMSFFSEIDKGQGKKKRLVGTKLQYPRSLFFR